jgi:hypothetical protein
VVGVTTIVYIDGFPACASLPVDTFFQADDEPTRQWFLRQRVALAVCRSCPLVEACLEQALRFPICEQVGVTGGETAAARKRILRDRRKAATVVAALESGSRSKANDRSHPMEPMGSISTSVETEVAA